MHNPNPLALWLAAVAIVPSLSWATPVHQWSKRFGDGANQATRSVSFDGSGNALVMGYMEGTADFGGGPLASSGSLDAFIAKYDPAGNHLWSKRFGSGAIQQMWSAAADAAGNIFVAGPFEGTIDFGGPTLTSSGLTDIFLAKLDPSGNHVWSKSFGGPGLDECRSVAVDVSGNVVIAAFVYGPVNFGGATLTSAGLYDVALAKFDNGGTHQWSNTWGDASDQQAMSVATDPSGNVIVGGTFLSTLDLGVGSMATAGGNDGFLARFSPSGVCQWSKRFGDGNEQKILQVGTDGSGSVFAGGYFDGSIDFGGGPLANAGAVDVFLARLSGTGSHIWSKRFGTSGSEENWGLATHSNGNVIVAGYMSGAADFGGGPLPHAGGEDIYMARFDPTGAHVWSKSFGSGSYQSGFGVAITAAGEILLGAAVLNSVNFGGGNLTSAGGVDAALARFSDDSPIPVLFQDFRAIARAGIVEVSWIMSHDELLADYALYRQEEGSAPVEVARGTIVPTVSEFVDHGVLPATTYRYELVVRAQSGEVFRSPIATVSTPPMSTSLEQNYPNPFNPRTTISFALASDSDVTLEVFDAAGRLVTTLLDGSKGVGRHTVDFDASRLSSGVYFYRLRAGDFDQQKKMVLLK